LHANGFWHLHCLPALAYEEKEKRKRRVRAMAKIMSALVTAILVALALLEWVATRVLPLAR
jgi:branched-subunit amino acid transport protein AzlD